MTKTFEVLVLWLQEILETIVLPEYVTRGPARTHDMITVLNSLSAEASVDGHGLEDVADR